MTVFREFPKIARLFRPVIVTEKIDGTNAQIYINELLDGDEKHPEAVAEVQAVSAADEADDPRRFEVFAGQRTKFCTPARDNFGFAAWVRDHAEELVALGPGQHFGEWWGAGIQRRYGLAEKRFSLFNVGRWYDAHGTNAPDYIEKQRCAPACCRVVPILARLDKLDTAAIDFVLSDLRAHGSRVAPGFKPAEGIVAFHTASGTLFKATCEKDEEWKGKAVSR